MASFTDEINKFNPYIEQLPVDDYIKVGMMAQGQYDAGVQAVQGAIDQISGLPIVRDVDKQYLRSALGKLEDKVKNVASSDFRNQQLIHQIQGATRSIARDKNVEAAVASSMFIQSEQELIKKQRAEGKSAPENEWDWSNAYQQYLNSEEVGEQFTYKYTPYRDVRKKVVDALKSINPDAKIGDNIFDANGNISDVMLRESFKGVSPEKIKNAILSVLDDGDMKQLSISGRYSMANYTPERLMAATSANIQSQRNILAGKRKQLEDTKAGLSSVQEQLAIQKKIDDLDATVNSLDSEESFYRNKIDNGDLDEVRAQLYSQQFLNQFGNAFSYTELSQTYLNNPAAEIAMQRAKMAQDWNKFQAEYEQEERHHAEDIKMKQEELKANGTGGYGGVPQTVSTNDLPDVNGNTFKNKIQETEKSIKTEEDEFLKVQGKDKAWLDSQRILYDQGKTLDPLVLDYFKRREGGEKEVEANKALLLDLEKEADKNIGPIKDIFKDQEGITYIKDKTKAGEGYNYSAEELYDLATKFQSVVKVYASVGTGGGGVSASIDAAGAEKLFTTEKEKLYFQLRAKAFDGKTLTTAEQNLVNRGSELLRDLKSKAGDIYNRRSKFISDQLAVRTGETQRVQYSLPVGKTEQRVDLRDRVNGLLARASDQKKSFGTETIRANYKSIKEMNDDEKTTYSLVVKGQTQFGKPKYWLRLNNGENKYQDIPLSPEDKQAIFGNRFESGDNPQGNPIDNKIRATNNGTTNFNGTFDPVKAYPSAYFTKSDFGGVKNFSVKGDIVNQSGRQALVLYIYEPKSKKYVRTVYAPPSGLMDVNQTMTSVGSINDAVVFQLLYGKAPAAEDMKEIAEINKKAFQ